MNDYLRCRVAIDVEVMRPRFIVRLNMDIDRPCPVDFLKFLEELDYLTARLIRDGNVMHAGFNSLYMGKVYDTNLRLVIRILNIRGAKCINPCQTDTIQQLAGDVIVETRVDFQIRDIANLEIIGLGMARYEAV